jgi:DUF971 family protein
MAQQDKSFTALDVHVDNDAAAVVIEWGDEHKSSIPVHRLRGWCPCAECQGHGGEIVWIDNTAAAITEAEPVGRYALRFTFDDNHATGIYRWEHLRKLDPAEASRWGEPADFLKAT